MCNAVWLLSSHQCVHLIRLLNCACLYKRNAYLIIRFGRLREETFAFVLLVLLSVEIEPVEASLPHTQNKQTSSHQRSTHSFFFVCCCLFSFHFKQKSMTATMKIMAIHVFISRTHTLATHFVYVTNIRIVKFKTTMLTRRFICNKNEFDTEKVRPPSFT